MNTFTVIIGAVVVVGGIYVLRKTNLAEELCDKLADATANMKDAFMEGYHEAAKATG
ncbi:hypothetical protein WDW37_06825 [Bdellovibrionota bacterium FG-1]